MKYFNYLFSGLIAAMLLLNLPLTSLGADDKSKEQTNLKELEKTLIESYLESVQFNNARDDKQVKIYNQQDELEFQGKADCQKARKIILKSDYLTEIANTLIYRVEE